MFEYSAVCQRVIDGDTIDVMIDLGFGTFRHEKMRLLGYDAPEISHPTSTAERELGKKAHLHLTGLIGMKAVRIKTAKTKANKDRQEKYGRYLASVQFLDAQTNSWLDVVEEMQLQGFVKGAGMSRDVSNLK